MAEKSTNNGVDLDDSSSESGSSSSKLADMESSTLVSEQRQTNGKGGDSDNSNAQEQGAVGGSSGAVSNIERLLQQQRNEIMFELRKLQLGERPVTGQGNKEAVESFFTSRINGELSEQEQRPENVVVEVNALVERRPVSSLLQSARFRRTLENALRSAITSPSQSNASFLQRTLQQRANSPALNQSTSNAQAGSPRHSSVASRASSLSGSSTNLNSSAPPRSNTSSPANSTTVPRSHAFSSAPLAPAPPPLPQIDGLPQQLSDASPVIAPSTSAQTNNTSTAPENNPAEPWPRRWLLQHTTNEIGESINIWDGVEQVQREEFIADIAELVQRQVVTNTLDGQFRNTLEHTMANRVANIGNGRRVQEYIQNIPRTYSHQRNDFSELGILPPDQQQALSDTIDNVSVISATAAVTVQNAHQNATMSRELASLKTQMNELKSMMKLSMELQLDTQRAIRQEVAAALAQALGSTVAPPIPANKPVDDAHCLICLDKSADSVLYQCGHLCVCHSCGLQLKDRGCHCPVCRAPIKDIIRAYKSGGGKQG